MGISNESHSQQNNNNSMSVSLVFIVVFGALVLVASLALGFLISTGVIRVLPEQASVQAQNTDSLFYIFLLIGLVVFFLVQGLLAYAVIRFRAKPMDTTDGPTVHGNTTLEIVWTLIPAVVVVILAILSYVVWDTNNNVMENENFINGESVPVHAIGQRYAWSFEWDTPEVNVEGEPITVVTNEFHTYVGQNVALEMNTTDVIHSFWVPAMRVKQDLLPGRTTEIRFTPVETAEGFEYALIDGPVDLLTAIDEGEISASIPEETQAQVRVMEMTPDEMWAYVQLGDGSEGWIEASLVDDMYNRYRIVCSELCGGGHGQMYSWLVVHESEEAFLTNFYEPSVDRLREPPADPVQRAELVIDTYACSNCHVLDERGWVGVTGPSLNGIADRAGERVTGLDGAEYIMQSIHLPNEYIVPGYAAGQMPYFGPSEEAPDGHSPYNVMPNEDLIAIVAYLCTQTTSGDAADNTCALDYEDIESVNARLSEISATYNSIYGLE
jgi:cytochrome c oxidase subunit 2